MRRDFTQPILDLHGKQGTGPDGDPATLGSIALAALNAVYEDERNLSGGEKAKRFEIMQRIVAKPREVDLTAEQITLLKMLIGKAYPPLAVGRAYELLEQEHLKAVKDESA